MNYDAIFDAKPRCLWEDQYILERLLAIRGHQMGMRVLDVASGTGRLLKPIWGGQYHALDRDQDMLALNPAAVKIHGDYCEMEHMIPISYDLVTFLFGVIHDYYQFYKILENSYTLLKPGGRFFGVILSKGRLDGFIHEELYKWGQFELFGENDVRNAFLYTGFQWARTNGMTASVWDWVEWLPSSWFDRFARGYMSYGIGDIPVKKLRWHYVVVEAMK